MFVAFVPLRIKRLYHLRRHHGELFTHPQPSLQPGAPQPMPSTKASSLLRYLATSRSNSRWISWHAIVKTGFHLGSPGSGQELGANKPHPCHKKKNGHVLFYTSVIRVLLSGHVLFYILDSSNTLPSVGRKQTLIFPHVPKAEFCLSKWQRISNQFGTVWMMPQHFLT